MPKPPETYSQFNMGCTEWCREEFRPSNFGFGHSRPELTVTAQWACLPPVVYVIWRWLAALYHVAWLTVSVAAATVYVAGRETWLAYLTNWTYFVLTLDLVCEAVASLIWYIHQRNPNNPVPKTTTWYMKMAWFMYSVASSVALTVGLAFWIIIFKDRSPDFYIDIQTHAITILYVVVNVMITAMPVRIYHLIYPLLYAVLYTVFTVIYYHAGGVNKNGNSYIYKGFLDWSKPDNTLTWISLVTFVGLPVTHVLLVYCGHLLRLLVNDKCCAGQDKVTDEKAEQSEMARLDNDKVISYQSA